MEPPLPHDDTVRDINRCGKDAAKSPSTATSSQRRDPRSKIVERSKLPSVATDDAHSKHMIAHSWIWVRVAERAKDEIIRNIKKGNFSVEKREI